MNRFNGYFLTFMLIALTGIPAFYKDPMHDIILIILFVYSYFLFFISKLKFNKYFYYYILFYLIISLLQAFFSDSQLITFIGFTLVILTCFFIVKLTGKNFPLYYVQILYVLTIISFVFYLPSLIIPGFQNYFLTNVTDYFKLPYQGLSIYAPAPNIILYTFNSAPAYGLEFIRNSGAFWEPGAFAGFLIIALLLNLIHGKNLKDKKNLFFIIAIISTFSTTGYLALLFLLFSYFFHLSIGFKKYIVLFLILIIAIISFYSLDFLSDKVGSQFTNAEYGNANNLGSNRFGSAYLDWLKIRESPLIGFGKTDQQVAEYSFQEVYFHRNNGLTELMVKFGFIGFIFYMFFLYIFLKRYCHYSYFNYRFAIYSLVIFLIIGFSETYFLRPLFIALTILPEVFTNKSIKELRESYISKSILKRTDVRVNV